MSTRVAKVLMNHGVFKSEHGLEGLLNADSFWESQPYGTRLYYGDGIADYLHRSVLRSAVDAITASCDVDDLRECNAMLLEACIAFVTAYEKSLQLEKTDVALMLAKNAIAKAKGIL